MDVTPTTPNPTHGTTAHTSGFSLVEILVAMGITVSALIVLLSLVGVAGDSTRRSQNETLAVYMANQVHTRIRTDPEWPPGTANTPLSGDRDAEGFPTDSFTWDELYFNRHGEIVEASDVDRQAYRGTLTFRRSPSYNSSRLEQITLQLTEIELDEAIAGFTFQRSRKSPRPEK